MNSIVIFVDAGYVYAAGSDLVVGEPAKRERLRLDASGFLEELYRTVCAQLDLRDVRLLRTYWYDGARDGIPTEDQRAVSSLPRVKLRLGRVAGGSQKGVDGLIILDLITLSQNRAVDAAVLVSGDEDLREAARYTQSHGVTVCLVGFPPTRHQRQSDALIRESDYHLLLNRDQFSPFLEVDPAPQQGELDLETTDPQSAPVAVTSSNEPAEAAEAAMDEIIRGILDDPRFVGGVTEPLAPDRLRRGVDRVLVARIAEAIGAFPVEATVLQRARHRMIEMVGHSEDAPDGQGN